MAHEKFKKPVRGRVWVEEGEKVPAVVLGEWNGWAVATVRVADVARLFGDSVVVTRRGDKITLSVVGMDEPGEGTTLKVRKWDGRVALGDGWSLYWEPT